jgi:hypothetical protein
VDLSGLSHCADLHERLAEVYRDEARPAFYPRMAEAT